MKLVLCIAATSLLLAASVNAYAALGGSMQSVSDDQARLDAKLSSATTGSLTVHTLQRSSDAAVREYMDQSGKVVAVAWSGPSKPDLAQILGPTYFARLANPGTKRLGGHQAMVLHDSDLVIESTGSMRRGFVGHAYLTSAINASVTPDQFK